MIHIGGKTYEIVHEHRTAWNPEMFRDRYSEVLDRYDYIVGDWGYNQLRLKGFFKENNPKSTKDSSLSSVMDYINEYCNFGCAYFILEKKPSKDGRVHSTDVLDTDAEMEGAATAEELSDADMREQGISLVPRTPSAEETSDLSENGQEERISRAERHRRAERQFRTERSEKQERNGGRQNRTDRGGNRGDPERGTRAERGERQERYQKSNRHHRSRNKQNQQESASNNGKQNNNGSREIERQRSVEEVRS